MSSAPAIKPQAVGVGSPIDAGYLSSVNLSDVLGKLLPGVASQPYQQQVAPVSASLPVSAPILAPVAAPALVEEEWEYLDPQSAIQGPFSSKGMRRWLESGYFKPELPIRVRSWTRFFPLGIVFPSQDVAFLKPIPEPGTQQNPLRGVSFEDPVMRQSNSFFAAEQQQRRQILEQQRQQQLQIEHQRQQQQQQLLLEQQRQQQLQSDQQRQQQAMEQHRQQQLLLERQQQQLLERHQQHQEEQRLMEMMQQQQQRQQAAPKSAPVVASWASTDTAKPQKTLKQIQQEEAQQSAAASIVPSVADPSSMSLKLKSLLGVTGAGPATGAAISSAAPWGAEKASTTAASASSTAHGKSLKEIQQEEQQEILRQQQLLLQQQQQLQKRLQQQQKEEEAASRHALSTASSWADKNTKGVATKGPSLKDIMNAEAQAVPVETQTAGRGSGNSWAAKLGVGQTPPPTVISRPAASTNVSASTTVETSSSAAPSKSVAPTKTPSAPSKSNGSTGTAGSKSTDFGGKKMLPELEEFCLASMQKLNGTNDITLLQFCMTLKSAAEIREYLAAYLGSKPEVSQFATEFIRRKEGGAPSASTGPSTAGAAVSSGVLKDVKILKRTPKK